MEIPSPDEQQKPEREGVGPLLGIIIIVSIFIIGGVYFLVMEELERRALPPTNNAESARRE